ncbi:YceI family protein [Amycolatopsis australiensis]|uniref:Polyisoprenoid-binding protein YceI n=1 Tax=Amycolatopsis australiensis TaxID=546364 RepID=A0A1K1SMJ6_9PSEU|nr:YceI family protein [Amycolatopsis australiensis]SFW85518.1 hypothetical protein SAMN04489730_6159 [Amycolatopsis australiensis]
MPDTEVLPAVTTFTLRRDRCVAEPSIRLLGLPLLRARLTATGGHFDDLDLTVVLDAASLRPGVKPLRRPLTGRRGLRAADHPAITFTGDVEPDGGTIDVAGRLEVAGTSRDLRLRGDLRHVGDDRVLLWLKGFLPAPRRKPRGLGPLARLVATRRIHVEFAAEFVR